VILISGTIFSLALLLFCFALYLFFINRAMKGKVPNIRSIPGLYAIEEAIKRAVEMRRPVFFSTGIGDITGGDMSQTLAGLALLSYAAKKSAELGAEFTYIACQRPQIVPIAEDLIGTAYGSNFKPSQIMYIPDQTSLMSTIIGTYQREKPAANLLLGALYWETVVLAEAGANVGAMNIGGTGRLYQVPYTVALCDYSLISEELMAAGAIISKEPTQLGTILASDILRYIVFALAVAVAVTGAVGYDITKIFTM
jgi:hypothetical protein